MNRLRPELREVLEHLLRGTEAGGVIELDAIGEAIGARTISAEEIDALLATIEQRGRRIASAQTGRGEASLKSVLDAARVLKAELGRAPRADEIAARAGIGLAQVQHALALAKVMQR